MLGIILRLMLFFVSLYTMALDPKNITFVLKLGFGFHNSILFAPSLFLILPFCGNEFLQWIMHSTGDIVMSLVYFFYGTECAVQRAP